MRSFVRLLTLALFAIAANATATNGKVLDVGISGQTGNRVVERLNLAKRAVSGYTQVFDGTGTGEDDRDASINADPTSYLTYTVLNNATYDVDGCLNFCNSVEGCVFANLYYEFNNYDLDFVFPEQSNLKCAVYGDVHSESEKTNFGGQQSYPPPAPLTYVQQSSGWSLDSATPTVTVTEIARPTPTSAQTRNHIAGRQVLPPVYYTPVFKGTGTGEDDRDASIEGAGYLTYTVVNNATYNIDECLDFCNSVEGCVFANIYYEFNNHLLDFESVFPEQSNLKCAVYSEVHSESEKTNFGGQQSYPPPAPLTYVQESSGWAVAAL